MSPTHEDKASAHCSSGESAPHSSGESTLNNDSAPAPASAPASATGKAPGAAPRGPSDEEDYPSSAIALAVMLANLFSMFLVSLDRTIIATAIPYITDHFHSIDDIAWYGSAYMLANCSVQLLYGRIYKFYSAKYVFLTAICLFEVGSAICGAAPTSTVLIIGRAIAGSGSAGIMSGVMQMLVHVVPLSKRPMYTSMFGAVGALSSVVGPLLGGSLTQRLSWRWCFYINLPFAAVSIAAVIFLVKARPPREAGVPFKDQIKQLDPLGTVIFIPCVVSLILALQWGGAVHPWNNGRIIALWVVFGVTLFAWIAIQAWKKDNATVPPSVFLQRNITAAFIYGTLVAGSMLLIVYYMAIWFQAIKDDDPLMSGISTLPSLLAIVISAALSGFVTQKIGYYVPSMILGPIISAIGAGLLTTFRPDSGHPKWIAYQFLYCFGVGMVLQQAMLAAQAVLPGPDISTGIALVLFGQQLGGAIFLAVAQSVFTQQLIKGLTGLAGLNPEQIFNTGATKLRSVVPASLLPQVLAAYNTAIIHTFYIAVASSCTVIIPALCMEWVNIKGKGLGRGPGSGPGRPGGHGGPGRPAEKPCSTSIPTTTSEKMLPTLSSTTLTPKIPAKNDIV